MPEDNDSTQEEYLDPPQVDEEPSQDRRPKTAPLTGAQERKVLIGADVTRWENASHEDMAKYFRQIWAFYKKMRDNFLQLARDYAAAIPKARRSARTWRLWLIWLTGGLAIVNLIAAFGSGIDDETVWMGMSAGTIWKGVSLFAAIYAALLTVLGNVEHYNNNTEKADKYRIAYDAALSAYQTFNMRWYTYVRPFGVSPEGCANATELYRQIVEKDIQIREIIGDLSSSKSKSEK